MFSISRSSSSLEDPNKTSKVYTITELNEDDVILRTVCSKIVNSKRCVVLTGAGISSNAGIPDFRSKDGLYNMVKDKYPDVVVRGKDLFDIGLFRQPETLSVFCTFMASLYDSTLDAHPTATHRFIKQLKDNRQLLRCYTQNIDCLESRVGMVSNMPQWKDNDVVQLHGDLTTLSCTSCFRVQKWDRRIKRRLLEGETTACQRCEYNMQERMVKGKRCTGTVGIMRPNIILYGENHPQAEQLAKGLNSDLTKKPDVFLIFGTSLKVDGVKKLVRSMAKAVHERGGVVVFVNATSVGDSCWSGIIDYHIQSDCDNMVEFLEKYRKLTPPATPKKRKREAKLPSPEQESILLTKKTKVEAVKLMEALLDREPMKDIALNCV